MFNRTVRIRNFLKDGTFPIVTKAELTDTTLAEFLTDWEKTVDAANHKDNLKNLIKPCQIYQEFYNKYCEFTEMPGYKEILKVAYTTYYALRVTLSSELAKQAHYNAHTHHGPTQR